MAIKVRKVYPAGKTATIESERENCVVCAVNPFLAFACVIGANCVSYTCPHSSSSSSTSRFSVSKIKVTLTCCSIALSVFMFFFNVYDFSTSKLNNVLGMVVLSEAVFCAGDVIAKLLSTGNSELRAEVLTYYQSIVDNRLLYGIDTMLKSGEIRTSRKRQIFNIYMVCCILLMYICISSLVKPFDGAISYLKLLNELLISYGQTTGIMQLNGELRLFMQLFEKCYSKIRTTLRNHQKLKPKVAWDKAPGTPLVFSVPPYMKNPAAPKHKSIEITLRRCRELHTTLISGIRNLNRCFRAIFIIWVILIITQLIINYYILIKSYGEFGRIEPDILMCLIRIGVSTPVAITVQFQAEFLATKVRDIMFINILQLTLLKNTTK